MTLQDIKPGDRARVLGFNHRGERSYLRKIMAHGLIPGAEFQLSRLAPLGDPIEILLMGCSLCLRKAEANLINIELI